MLNNIINQGLLQCRGTIGFFRANTVGDDIEVYDQSGQTVETLHGLRQQVCIVEISIVLNRHLEISIVLNKDA